MFVNSSASVRKGGPAGPNGDKTRGTTLVACLIAVAHWSEVMAITVGRPFPISTRAVGGDPRFNAGLEVLEKDHADLDTLDSFLHGQPNY
jgi:hypothetical protein